ncbi:MAG: hypothetical protein MJA27_17285 [Pseudanabaenales cyanobacterium]|nr:hypothetical protein [Pseudanabaenales cyanobacterium]
MFGGVGGIGGGAIGAVGFGAVFAIVTIATGGTGAAVWAAATAAASAGATGGGIVGGASGAVVGAVVAQGAKVHHLEVSDSELIKRFAEYCLTVIYGLSHHGYGAKPEIDNKQMAQLLDRVSDFNQKRELKVDWLIANRETIHSWCEDTLNMLES